MRPPSGILLPEETVLATGNSHLFDLIYLATWVPSNFDVKHLTDTIDS